MATLVELCNAGVLVKVSVPLDDGELPQRYIYAFPSVVKWLDEELPDVVSFLSLGSQDPTEQLDEMFYDFIVGEDFSLYARCHSMRPDEPGVWELKTPDIRIFGWFAMRSMFVIADIDTAKRVKEYSLYTGYRDSVVRKRDKLELDEPKFITGEYSDVL